MTARTGSITYFKQSTGPPSPTTKPKHRSRISASRYALAKSKRIISWRQRVSLRTVDVIYYHEGFKEELYLLHAYDLEICLHFVKTEMKETSGPCSSFNAPEQIIRSVGRDFSSDTNRTRIPITSCFKESLMAPVGTIYSGGGPSRTTRSCDSYHGSSNANIGEVTWEFVAENCCSSCEQTQSTPSRKQMLEKSLQNGSRSKPDHRILPYLRMPFIRAEDMCERTWFLSIKFQRDRSRRFAWLLQEHYVEFMQILKFDSARRHSLLTRCVIRGGSSRPWQPLPILPHQSP